MCAGFLESCRSSLRLAIHAIHAILQYQNTNEGRSLGILNDTTTAGVRLLQCIYLHGFTPTVLFLFSTQGSQSADSVCGEHTVQHLVECRRS